MFNQLLESKAKKDRMAGGTVFSVVLHTLLIAGAVYATATAGVKEEKKAEKIQFVEMKKEPPPEKPKEAPPPKEVVVKPPLAKGFQVLRAPVKIDIKIPEIDLSKAVTNESDFTGKGVKGGVGSGVAGGTIVNTDQTYFEFQVERPAAALDGNPTPRYPPVLESSGIAGEVQAQFVVLSSGKADIATFKILKSTNELFSQSVKNVLPRMRFSPAQIGGKPVNQLVQQSFVFAVPR
jgi:protein TonB